MVCLNNSPLISRENTIILLKQMGNRICVVYDGARLIGSGFFCIIPYKNQKLKVLITASFNVETLLKKNKIIIGL